MAHIVEKPEFLRPNIVHFLDFINNQVIYVGRNGNSTNATFKFNVLISSERNLMGTEEYSVVFVLLEEGILKTTQEIVQVTSVFYKDSVHVVRESTQNILREWKFMSLVELECMLRESVHRNISSITYSLTDLAPRPNFKCKAEKKTGGLPRFTVLVNGVKYIGSYETCFSILVARVLY